ncbi:MAG TPA: acyl-CoA dehydrogenase family protein [Steroidobacteraceae bacterium]|nr:acyl-CoA dehydrogenase family protein [Steroidobacteraceae bacterium]
MVEAQDGPSTADTAAEFELLRAGVEKYVRGPAERWAEQIERDRQVPPQVWAQLRELGYLSLAAPASLGGRGLSFSRYLELMELFGMSHAAVRMIVHVVNGIWRALDRHATEEQRRRFVRPCVAGELKVAFALTEPGAGTGADLRCSLTREGDRYRLTGEKHMITFGSICDYWLLFARRAGTAGAEGTVALLVPRDAPNTRVDVMPESMGVRGSDHARMRFDGAPVPVANRLGEEGQGLEIALGGFLAPSRISVAMSCVGLARRALELAIERSRSRETFGKPLWRRQAIAFLIADMATELEAARRLVLHAAAQWERSSPQADMLSSMSKLFAVSMLQRVTDGALQVHGGIGYWQPHPIERVYRDARAQRFEEGTNEIQKTVIAREIFKGGCSS